MTEQPGRLHPTRLRTLLWVAAAGVVVGWFGVTTLRRATGTVPSVPWSPVLALLFAAAVLGGIAWQTWSVLQRQRRRMDPHRAVSFLVLAKASVLVGAAVAGVYAGYALHYVDVLGYAAPAQRALRAGVGTVAGALIVVAGVLLERACIVPGAGSEDDRESGDDGRNTTGGDGGDAGRHDR